MKSSTTIWQVIAICIFITFSCEKNGKPPNNIHKDTPKIFSDYLGKTTLKNFSGIVLDSVNNPLDSVHISIGNKTTVTNVRGEFSIDHATVNTLSENIIAKRKGYKNYTVDISKTDSLETISIQLEKESHLCLFWFCRYNHNLSK